MNENILKPLEDVIALAVAHTNLPGTGTLAMADKVSAARNFRNDLQELLNSISDIAWQSSGIVMRQGDARLERLLNAFERLEDAK